MILDGLKKCRVCLETFSVDHFYYNKNTKGYTSACKPCHIKRVKGWTKNKAAEELLKKAKRGAAGLKICWNCNQARREDNYVEWDCRLYLNGEYLLGEQYICAVCYDKIKKKAFRKVYGAIEHHNEQRMKRNGKSPRKKRKLETYNTKNKI